MAYRYEKNANGETDLVISGWEKGIADSPYLGIANMRNVNTSWYPGVAYTAYKRIRVNTAGGNQTFLGVTGSPNYLAMSGALTLNVGDAVTFSTNGTLPAPLVINTTYFVSAITVNGANNFQVSATLGGAAITITTAGVATNTVLVTTMGKPVQAAQNNSDGNNPYGTIYILDNNGRIWQNTGTQTTTGLPYFVLLYGNTLNLGSSSWGLAFYSKYLFVIRGNDIDVNGDASGTINSTLWSNSWFTSTALTLTGAPVAGATSATISGSAWPYATGTYNVAFVNETVSGLLTNSQNTLTWTPALKQNETTAINVNLGLSGLIRMAFVSNTNILYFCNGRYIGAISTPAGYTFSKVLTGGGGFTNHLNYAALTLPPGVFSTWLDQQQTNLLVAAQETIYPWDQISTFYGTPLPITENIVRMINISNTVYVLAGLKGNIYVTNGYSISVVKKIPDAIAGVIDPLWGWGSAISHRQKLYFSVLAQNGQTGTGLLNGVFSVDEQGNLNFENQNSNGLTNASATADAVLFDVNTTTRDSYYSSFFDGVTGGIDYNGTTLYSSNEPVIETDLIPIGTFAQSKTFQSMEFKLDQPMQSGDSITVYARQSLSDTFVQVGTTTTAVLSDFYQPVNFQKWQWVQFKITISCNSVSTSSSFVRLREIRIR